MAEPAGIRAALQERLARLEARMARIESDRRRPGEPDSQERASQQENDEVLDRLDATEREELSLVRAALARIDAGDYGRCRVCDDEIQTERLRAVPFTDTCRDCATRATV